MKIAKQYLMDMERCYAVNTVMLNGEKWVLNATEGHGSCYAYKTDDLDQRKLVWEQPGGTMSFVPIPGVENEFLAIQKFFKLYEWEAAEIVWVTMDETDSFHVKSVLPEPYIHRFDVFETDAGCFFVGCSLAAHKDTREDWTRSGKILVGSVNKQTRTIENVTILRDDLFQNHGYWRCENGTASTALIGCRNGVFRLTPPTNGRDWSMEQIADFPVSDMALVDIDGDGVEEMATIEPFHGRYYRIYKQGGDAWRQIYEHPVVEEFYHVVWGGMLCGKPAFISGCRRGAKQLCSITFEDGEFHTAVVEEGVGPSNVHVLHQESGPDLIFSANREAAHFAAYALSEL